MTLISQVKFSQNVLYHMKDDFFVENSKSQNNYISWVFTEMVRNDPVQKFTYALFLILCSHLNDPQLCFVFCLVIVVRESIFVLNS